MGHYITGDDGFEYKTFAAFPILEHLLQAGRTTCAPRFELLASSGAPLAEAAFLAELGDVAPLGLRLHEDSLGVPTLCDLNLFAQELVGALRMFDRAIIERYASPEARGEARVRWSIPLAWEIDRGDFPAVLAKVNASLPKKKAISLEYLGKQDPDEVLEQVFDTGTRLGKAWDALPEHLAFALAVLACARSRDVPRFGVEDDPTFYEYREGAEPRDLFAQLSSPVLGRPEGERVERIQAHARRAQQSQRVGASDGDVREAVRLALAWSWGVRDRAAVAFAYRLSAAHWLSIRELERAEVDATWSLHLEQHGRAFDVRGIARHLKGDVVGATADYTRSLALAPDVARVWLNRGEAHLDASSYEACIQDCTRAIDLAPEQRSAFVFRGRALARLGRGAEARVDAERAAELGDRRLLEELDGWKGG